MSKPISYQQVDIRPVECFQAGWRLIESDYWLFLGITFLGLFIAQLVPIILIGPMFCGIFLCLFQKMRGEKVDFEMLFKGFDYFADSLIACLIVTGISLVVVMVPTIIMVVGVVMAAAVGGADEAMAGVVVFLLFLLGLAMFVLVIVVQLLFAFVFPLIVDKGAKPMEAVKLSVAGARANLWGLFCLQLFLALVSLVALALCVIPVYLVLPIMYATMAVVYRKIYPEQ